ncbi:MAG: hypothetical protein WCJ66_11925 [Verrucomicrobiota bacterium]
MAPVNDERRVLELKVSAPLPDMAKVPAPLRTVVAWVVEALLPSLNVTPPEPEAKVMLSAFTVPLTVMVPAARPVAPLPKLRARPSWW